MLAVSAYKAPPENFRMLSCPAVVCCNGHLFALLYMHINGRKLLQRAPLESPSYQKGRSWEWVSARFGLSEGASF